MEPATIVAIIGIIISLIGTIIGFLWRRYKSLRDEIEVLRVELDDANNRTKKLMAILFGREINPDDDGLTAEVRDGFQGLAKEIEELDEDVDDLDGAMKVIIIKLDEDEDIDFDKDNLDFKAELEKLK